MEWGAFMVAYSVIRRDRIFISDLYLFIRPQEERQRVRPIISH